MVMKELIRFDEETQRTFLKEVSEWDGHVLVTRFLGRVVSTPFPHGEGVAEGPGGCDTKSTY